MFLFKASCIKFKAFQEILITFRYYAVRIARRKSFKRRKQNCRDPLKINTFAKNHTI